MKWYLFANNRYIATYYGTVTELSRAVRVVRFWHGWAIDISEKEVT